MTKLLTKIVDVKPDEIRALWLAFVFNFLVLGGYYIMRPIRDSIAGANKLETLPWMFTATLVAMLIANAVFAAIVARMSRRRFIPLAYGFFIFNLALFFILMRTGSQEQQVWIGRALFVWVSVFNLFNTANLIQYSGNIANTAAFGQPGARFSQVFGSGGPRAFQLGARVSF